MPKVQFDRYYRYAELTEILEGFAADHPDLVAVESVGKSHEGRDILVATVTNTKTGPAEEKPAFWVDGNIHSSEVAPSSACLYLISKLVTEYGKNDDVTRVVDTRTFYICPRVNPDGAELVLADRPRELRSGTRPWPFDEEPFEGLKTEDMDGDGRILMMRIPDPNGQWKPYPDEPRLMVRRDPSETGGTYYRIAPEGPIADYDGISFEAMPKKENLDFNRNFPAGWRTEGEQKGAGPYPTSEVEVRAMVDFISRHTNITGAIDLHTWSGVILRPFCSQSDEEMAAEDLWTFKTIGAKGSEITDYPNISIFHDFKYHPKQVISGGSIDWIFGHLGLYAWAVEIWSPQRQAGVEMEHAIDWYRDHPVEDDLTMLKWSDEKLGGNGYIDWYEFEHPQIGSVELGGWDYMYCWRNPPAEFLEAEIAPLSDWMIWHLLISPRLEIFKLEVESTGGDTYQIKFTVQNSGWLPTYVSKQAVENKAVRGVVYEISIPDGATILVGKERMVGEQLEGRAYQQSSATPWAVLRAEIFPDRATAEWVVRAPARSKATITARHDRAGTVREEVVFPAG